jgi:phospholipid-translocating ATPase
MDHLASLVFSQRGVAVASSRVVHLNSPRQPLASLANAVVNTKYTRLNFVPKNLMEQFSRPMAQYFLLIACLQLFRDITPVNPLTTWLPLIVIFAVTAVKEGLDDAGRARADAAANCRLYSVMRSGAFRRVPSRDIVVGDLLRLVEGEEVPADCVLLSSSDAHGNAYIQTSNLDGESNLKARSSLTATRGLATDAQLSALRGEVECGPPDEHLYVFDAQLRMGGAVLALSSSQLLLQATSLRNTDWAMGLVVYTGNDSKFGRNKKPPPTK